MQSCMIHILNHAYLTRRCSKIFFLKKKVSQKPAFPWTDGPTRNAFFIPSSSEKLCTSSARLLPSPGSNCRSRLVPGPLLTDDVMRTKAQFGVSDDFTSSRQAYLQALPGANSRNSHALVYASQRVVLLRWSCFDQVNFCTDDVYTSRVRGYTL